MGKSACPKWVKRKEKCAKCGMLFYPVVKNNQMQSTDKCSICDPNSYNQKKDKS